MAATAALAGLYAALAIASLRLFATLHASASPVWPPTGLAIAALLLYGRRLWPGVLVGAFVANALTEGPLWTSLLIATGNTLEAYLAATLLARAGGAKVLDDAPGLLRYLVVAGVLGPVVSATIGVSSLAWAGSVPPDARVEVWLTWFLGDAAGAVIVGPVLLRWLRPAPRVSTARRREAVLFFAVMMALGLVAVLRATVRDGGLPLSFLAVPFIVWPALRLGGRLATLATLAISALATYASLRGEGLFSGLQLNQGLLLLQAFLIEMAATSHLIVATIGERESARRAMQQARDAEERFRALIESAPDATLLVGEDGGIQLANAQAEALFGHSRADFARLTVEDLMPDRFRARHVAHRAAFHAAAHARPMGVGMTLFALRKDGTEVPVEISLGPYRTKSGMVVVTSIRDITQRRKAEEELEASRRQVAMTEKLAALGTLVAGVGHEVRTPLTYIATNLALVRIKLEKALGLHPDLAETKAQVDRYIAKSQDGVARIDNLVRQLRMVAKSELLVEQVGLHVVVRDAVELFQATHKGSIVVGLQAQEFPAFAVDKGQLQQVVLNLLANAAEAMGGQGTIQVRLASVGDDAELTVQDHGPGMPADVQARMYDPFFTTKPQGTGLGLPISRRIVEGHGGTITFTTSPHGTTFRVRLPRVPRRPAAGTPPPGPAAAGAP